jgi:hypothetical protein
MTNPPTREENNQRIIDERIRAIEQIKRLYAVIMGFAITQLIGNQYAVTQTSHYSWRVELPFLVAQTVTFGTLITLFYLGAERMLEARYLRADSPVATRWGLLIDLVMLATQGFMFVFLANTVPGDLSPPQGTDWPAWRIQLEQANQLSFVDALIVINALDACFLAIQLVRLARSGHISGPVRAEANRAHWIWLRLNCLMLILLLAARQVAHTDFSVCIVTINLLSALLVIFHLARFWADYARTFRFYYPSEQLT